MTVSNRIDNICEISFRWRSIGNAKTFISIVDPTSVHHIVICIKNDNRRNDLRAKLACKLLRRIIHCWKGHRIFALKSTDGFSRNIVFGKNHDP